MKARLSGYIEERRKMISDAFHTLNQPLTGLHCGLEIALQKPRAEGEYRKRIGEGIEHAGAILTLVRAVRQLVEACDPGERFGTVDLSLVFSQLKNELEVVAETSGVAIEMEYAGDAQVESDPGKLLATLGGLVASEMETYEAGAVVNVAVKPSKKNIVIELDGKGARIPLLSEEPQGPAEKLAEIRRNAAISYLWTLGGDFEVTAKGLKIKLPVVEK